MKHSACIVACLLAGEAVFAADIAARHAAAVARVRTFVYNTDGCDMLYYPTNANINVDAFIGQRLGYVRDTRISTISYCPLSSGFGWFTLLGVGDPLTNTMNTASSRMNATLRFAEIGHDCLEMALAFGRDRGMERFLSIRMNDSHDGSSRPHEGKFHPLFSTFRRQHPECLMGDPARNEWPQQCAWQWTCVDYGHAAVQDHVRKFIRQFCEKYDMDGIELDFCRHPKYFKRCSYGGIATDAERATMTALLADIRSIVRAAEKRRDRPILLHARVPDSVEYCRDIGLDLAAWLKAGLLDGIIGGCYFNLNDWKTMADFAHSLGARFYASIDESRIPGACKRWGRRSIQGRDTLENYCASYAQAMSAGCDGIYLFNIEHERLRAFTQVDPRETDGLDKIYFATQRGKGGYEPTHYLKDGYRYKNLPYIDPAADPDTVLKDQSGLHDPGLDFAKQYHVNKAREFGIRIGDDFARAAAKGLRPRITVMALATELSASDARFSVNGHALKDAEFGSGLFIFRNVPPDWFVKGVNTFQVAPAGKPFVLNDFAVKIEYAQAGR
ncbi:MAG: hypothetical protein IKO72_14710 [Kiritimatiellae bacterium]|nr:hypothetical protein [Kiritimatiellia bacterium]